MAEDRKRWEDMTFEEKMETIEDDFNHSRAMRVQQEMLEPPEGPGPTIGPITDLDTHGRMIGTIPNVQNMPRQSNQAPKVYETLKKIAAEKNIKIASYIHDELLVEVPEDYQEKDALYTAIAFDLETMRGSDPKEQEMTLTVLKKRREKKEETEDEEKLSVCLPRGTGRCPP